MTNYLENISMKGLSVIPSFRGTFTVKYFPLPKPTS